MGLNDVVMSGYTPKENQEFGGRKKLVGDAVCQVELKAVNGKKDGKLWYILKGEAIHPIADPKGRETTVEAGDEISKLYDSTDSEAIQELMDDLFTAGITFVPGATDEATLKSMQEAAKDKLVYFRTWAKDKTVEQKAKKPDGPGFFQNIKVLSASKVTPENSTPVLAF
jgi:hypothetical protein